MKKISLQWELTLLTTALITILCGCLTFFLYKTESIISIRFRRLSRIRHSAGNGDTLIIPDE